MPGPRKKAAPKAYDVHPSVAMVEKWVAELKERTGRTLAEWVRHIRAAGPGNEPSSRAWLKEKYDLGTNSAWWLAERAFASPGAPNEDTPAGYLKAAKRYVEDLYSGDKAGLRPTHDALLLAVRALGADIRVCPCKTMVPVFRNHVIAQIKPGARTRIDFGLALGKLLGKKKLPARLIDTGGFAKKDRITHRIALAAPGEVDDFVRRWLASAYELDG